MEDKQKRDRRAKNAAKDIQALRDNMGAETGSGFGVQILSFIIILLFIAVAGFWFLRPDKASSSILVYNAGLNVPGEQRGQEWIAEATEQAIIAYLDVGDQVHIVGAEAVRGSESNNGADWTVSGTITMPQADTGTLNLALKLKSTTPGGQEYSAQLIGVNTGLSDLAARASGQIYTWLERPALSIDERAAALAELPRTEDARKAYAEGIANLARYDAAKAVPKFEVALRDGDHPLVYAGLGRAWAQLGYRERAQKFAQKSYDNRRDLSRQKQLEIEGSYRIATDEWPRAIEVYQALKEFHPGDISYRLALADVQLKASDMDGVLQNINDMRTLPTALRDDPRIDLAEVNYWHQKGNYAKAKAAAQIAIGKARLSGDEAVLAAALLAEVDNIETDEDSNKMEHLLEAQQLYDKLDNPGKQSSVLYALGQQERFAGRIVQAKAYYRDAIEKAESIGDAPRIAAAKNPLAITLDLEGDLETGLFLKREVLSYFTERDIKSRQSIMIENIGISLFKLGRLKEAEASFDEALDIFNVIGDTIGIAWAPYHRSRIASRSGDLDKAARLADEAVANSEKNPEGDLEINAKYEVAHILFHRGKNDEAKTMFTQLEQAFLKAGNEISTAESALMLSRIAFRQKDYALATIKMNEALTAYETNGVGYYILDALTTRADLAFLHDGDDIDAACTALRQNLLGMQHTETALRARSRLLRCNGAVSDLSLVESAARDLGYFEPQLDVAIIKAQLWEQAGKPAFAEKARARGRELATSKGWAFQ